MNAFFPDILFGWVFYFFLVAFTLSAAYIDFRRLAIPKWITVPMFGMGIIFNVVRGVWLGSLDNRVWLLEPAGLVLSGLDGFLFSLCGFTVAFVFFFLVWMVGACRGGDTKLFAAVGAWVGPVLVFWILIGSLVVLGLLYIVGLVIGSVTKGPSKTFKAYSAAQKKVRSGKQPEKINIALRLMTYALPVAIATAVVLLWFFRYDLHLVTPPVPPTSIY